MLVPPVNKFTQGNRAGKAVSPASSAGIQCQISKQPTSQKNNDANRVPLKRATPGWRPPSAHLGPNNNLVISFSNDDSQSDSADFRAYVIDNPSFLYSSRQNEQAGLGLDYTNNLSENVNLIPMSSHQMPQEHNGCNLAVIDSNIQCVNGVQIPNSYQHLSGENIGSEPCSEPDASTSETMPLLGNNGTVGVCSPSNEPNGSTNEDDDIYSFKNESAQPNNECHIADNQKETDNESNRIMSVDPNEESLLLEKASRSTLFAKLGTKIVSKNSVVCNGTGIAVEREAENDARSEEPQKAYWSSPFSEVEKKLQFDIEGADGQKKSFTEAPLEIQREHSIKHFALNPHSSGYFEDRCFVGGDLSLTSTIFSPSYILSSAFGYMKVIDPNNTMEHQDRSQQSGTCDTNIEEGDCINSGKAQFSSTMIDTMKKTLVKLCDREDGSYTTGPAVDPFWPLCMYELRGKCNNDECPWRHVKDYSTTDMSQHQHDNSEIADCQVGQTSCNENCDGSAKVPWRHKNQPDQALADNEQCLEKALLIFSQEVNALEGMRKALPVLSQALEDDPTSLVLWVSYLLIYYSNMKSVGKDDMFSCAENTVCCVAHSTGTGVLPALPMLVPAVNKFAHGNQAGKAVSPSSSRVSGSSLVEQGSRAGNFNSLKAEAVPLNCVADEKAEAKLCTSQLESHKSLQDHAQPVQSLDGDNADLVRHGTTNVVIRLKIGVIIAVDSRAVITHIFFGTSVKVKRIVNDNAMKFIEVTSGVYLTASGSANRNEELWEHLIGLVNKGVCTDIESLRDRAHTYLKEHPLPSTSSGWGVQLFMAGWSPRKKEYVVYRIADGDRHTFILRKLYDALGSGAGYALEALARISDAYTLLGVLLEKCDFGSLYIGEHVVWNMCYQTLGNIENIELDMDKEQAGQAARRALLRAASTDPSSGGYLRVYFGTESGHRSLCERHTMSMIKDSPESTFLKNELYVILPKQNGNDLSDILCTSLLEFDHGARVQCLGDAGHSWFLYHVIFDSEEKAKRMLFSCQIDRRLSSLVRVRQFSVHPTKKDIGFVGVASRVLLGRALYMSSALSL